jgi:hypothetical protein
VSHPSATSRNHSPSLSAQASPTVTELAREARANAAVGLPSSTVINGETYRILPEVPSPIGVPRSRPAAVPSPKVKSVRLHLCSTAVYEPT